MSLSVYDTKILEQDGEVEIVQARGTNPFKSVLNHWASGNHLTLLSFKCLLYKMKMICVPQYYWKRLNETICYKLACQVILVNNGLWQLEVGGGSFLHLFPNNLTSRRSILTKASLCHLYKYSLWNSPRQPYSLLVWVGPFKYGRITSGCGFLVSFFPTRISIPRRQMFLCILFTTVSPILRTMPDT